MSSNDMDKELMAAAKAGDSAKVSKLLLLGANPRSLESGALQWAASNGHAECLMRLLPVSDAKADDSCALRLAAQNGHAECLRLLLPVSDAKAGQSLALRVAAQNGHAKCLLLLLDASDPKAKESYALRTAANNGHVECVRLLLPLSDPKALDCEALMLATRYEHVECARLLLAASGPLRAIDGLLEKVINAGSFKMAALLIGEEPQLLEGLDLSKCVAAARENGHADLASYFSAIMDQKELLEIAADRPARSLARPWL